MTIELNEDDFSFLLVVLGYATGKASLESEGPGHIGPHEIIKLTNAINRNNPNWTPYAEDWTPLRGGGKRRMAEDILSVEHYRRVWAEIQGRFFTQKEADELKELIDHHTVTDPEIRAAGAKAWT
jgi:hypothetical protein